MKQEQGIDITKSYFLLELHEKNGPSGKVYVPDIKIVEENTPKNMSNKTDNMNDSLNKSKLYEYISGSWADYNNQKIPMLIFKNADGKESPLYILKDANKKILHLAPGTVIGITKFRKNKNNMIFLEDYNIVKAVEKKKENKKAV